MKTITLNGKTFSVQLDFSSIGKIESALNRPFAKAATDPLTVLDMVKVLVHTLRDENGQPLRDSAVGDLAKAAGYRELLEACAVIFSK